MPINKFTTLLDLARQAKIISGETATFDGKIQAGIPFSGYPTGVDTGTTVSLGVVSSQTAVFSGNTGTTIFDVSNPSSPNYDTLFSGYSGTVWTNPLFSGNTSGLTLPIVPLSADTQIVGPFWTLTQTGMTGDYVIGIQYTGYSITYSFFGFENPPTTAFTSYSGFTTASQENFSAGTLDYKGPLDYISTKEDASVEGRLTTNKITITNGASASTIGYVLTQTGENGEAEWVINSSADTNTYVTGGTLTGTDLTLDWNTGGSANPIDLSGLEFTGNTSGDCINDIYVKNIHSCSPLFVNPNDEGNVYFGSSSGVTINFLPKILVGIGTNNPSEMLHVNGGDILVTDTDGSFSTDIQNSKGPLTVLSGDTTELTRFGVTTPIYDAVTFGIRGASEPSFPGYGKQGDAFIYSSAENNGFNIVSRPGTGTDDYVRFFVGQASGAAGTPDLYIQGSGTTRGFVGINNENPIELLHTKGGDVLIEQTSGKFFTDIGNSVGPLVIISGSSNALPRYGVQADPPSGGGSITFGIRGTSEVTLPGYGKQGDSFIRAADNNNGLNVISATGVGTEDYIRFYAGQDANGTTPDIYIQGSGTTRGNVGINTDSPSEKLHVNGSIRIVDGTEQNGYVLTSDANGVGSWQPSSGGSGTFTGGTVSGFTNFIGGLESEDFNGNLGSTNTFYVSGNSGSFNQIRLETLFSPTQPTYLSVGRGVSQLVSESGTTTSNFRVESGRLRLSRNTTGGEQSMSFGLSGTQMLVSDTLNSKGLEYFADYSSNYTNRSLVDKEYVDNQVGGVPAATTATTTTINFTGQTIYYDSVTPGTGNISEDLTGAKLGLIQKIYHNDGTEPTYPAGWVLMGDAIYFTSTLNIIYAEWAGGSRVEYWYVQEQ